MSPSLFAATVSAEEVAHGKPAPDVYLEAARRLGVAPASCAAVEDSTNGLRAAADAGMLVIAYPNREFPPDAGRVGLAGARIGSLDELRPELIDAAQRISLTWRARAQSAGSQRPPTRNPCGLHGIIERPLVGAIHAHVEELIAVDAHDEGPRQRPEPHAVGELVDGVDFRDPDVVLVPFGAHAVRGAVQPCNEAFEHGAHRFGATRPLPVHGEDATFGRGDPHHRSTSSASTA